MSHDRARQRELEDGFSLVEVLVSGALLVAILGVVTQTLMSGQRASRSMETSLQVSEDVRRTLHRIGEELRTATRAGEDRDGDAVLDPGEDQNGNGRLDADWAVTATSITFNRYLADGTISLPVTYSLNGTEIERAAMADAAGTIVRAVVARSVQAFAVTDSGGAVSIDLTVVRTNQDGTAFQQQQSLSITPRN